MIRGSPKAVHRVLVGLNHPYDLGVRRHVARDGHVPGVLLDDAMGRGVDGEVDLGEEAPVARGAGHDAARADAVVRLVGVPAHDHLDGGAQLVQDRDDVAREPLASVVGPAQGLHSALMDAEDDGRNPLLLQLRGKHVRRGRLIAEREPCHRARPDDARRLRQRLADEGDPRPAEVADAKAAMERRTATAQRSSRDRRRDQHRPLTLFGPHNFATILRAAARFT